MARSAPANCTGRSGPGKSNRFAVPASTCSDTHSGPEATRLAGNHDFHDQVSDGWQLVGAAEIDGSGGWVVVRVARSAMTRLVRRTRSPAYS